MDTIRRSVLDNGLRIVTESLPQLRSVTIGAWVGTGARDETDDIAGASHFLEHLLFKGSATRGAREIAESIESVGGEMNAFTSHEQTVFYVRVPASEIELGLDVLSDVVWNPAFRPDEVESERQVILEELAMRDDTPDDLVHDLFAEVLFPQHELGRAVIGSAETVTGVARDAIADYHRAHYRPANVVFAVAGNIEHDAVVRSLERAASHVDGDRPARVHRALGDPGAQRTIVRDTEQANVVLGMRAFGQLDPDRYALAVFNQAFGGGMSSRLFQEVREERGLAYSVYSYRAGFDETGALAIYAGTSTERLEETLGVIHAELDKVRSGGLTDAELAAAKGHLSGSLMMSLETSSSRMRRLGRGELVEGEIPSLDELVARVESVDHADVERVLDRVVRAADGPVMALVGPGNDEPSPSPSA